MADRPPFLKDKPDLGKCECCEKNDAIGVASTSIPYSAAYCADCAAAGRDPYWVLVANTAGCGGLHHTNKDWQAHVKHGLDFYNKTIEEFTASVDEAIERMGNAD